MVEKIIARERAGGHPIDALLPTMGGQTALNTAMALARIGCAGALWGRADRRQRSGDRQGRGPPAVPPGDGPDRPRLAEKPARRLAGRGARRRSATIGLPAIIRPSFTLGGTGGGIAYNTEEFEEIVRGGLRASPAHEVLIEESVLGWKEYELEVVRDRQRQLHRRLLDREHRPDGGAHRRFGDGRAGADPDRQGIPADAQRRDRGAARDRRRYRRVERAVRGQPGGRPARHHRDEPAGVALVGAGVEGDRFPDRQDRRQARGRLHARRTRQRDHRRYPGLVRADDRLRRHQDAALHVREIPRRRAAA